MTTAITAKANDVYRSFEIDGVSSSPEHKPGKAELKALFQIIEDTWNALSAANGVGYRGYVTLANMNADSSQPTNTMAVCFEDENEYRYSGSAWVLRGPSSSGRLTRLEGLEIAGISDLASRLVMMSMTNYMATASAGKSINTSGAEVSASGRYVSGFIKIDDSMKVTRIGSTVNSGSYPPYAWYDSEQAFIDYDWAEATDNVHEMDVATTKPAGAVYLRLSAVNSTNEYYVYQPKLLALLRDMVFSQYGLPEDQAGTLSNKYVIKSGGTSGETGNSSSWRMTEALRVSADSIISLGCALVSETDATRCQIAFYNSLTTQDHSTFLGYYNPKARYELVRVSDFYPTALSVRIVMPSTGIGTVYVLNSNPGYAAAMAMMATALKVDYFAENLENGRLTFSGGLTQTTSDSDWRTTTMIPVVPGQKLRLTCNDITSLGSVVAGFSASRAYHSSLVDGATNADFLDYEFEIPSGVYYIRATFNNTALSPTPHLYGVRVVPYTPLDTGEVTGIVYFAPTEAYARFNEDAYMFTAGIVPLRSAAVGWAPTPGAFDVFMGTTNLRFRKDIAKSYTSLGAMNADTTQANGAICKNYEDGQYYKYSTGSSTWALHATAETNIKIAAMNGTALTSIGTIPIKFVDADALVAPTKKWNIIFIGDSTTSQLSSDPDIIDGDGCYTNEFSRQLTGTGDVSLVVGSDGASTNGSEWGPVVSGDIRPAKSLTNIKVRGTRGTGTVKHEGRGGWHPSSYLERDNAMTLKISAALVTGNTINGNITVGSSTVAITPIAFTTNNDTTLAALAAEIQTRLRSFGTGTNPPTAVAADTRNITINPKWSVTFSDFAVTGGASQATITFPGDGKFNAFWDSTLTSYGPEGTVWKFGMKRYLETYGWTIADVADGVTLTGDNLLVSIALAWNPYGSGTDAAIAAGQIAAMIDQIHREYPDAIVWLVGLWAPPLEMFKGNTGSIERWYEAVRTFNESVKAFGDAYRAVANDPLRVSPGKTVFVDVAHMMDPNFAYSKSTYAPNRHATDSSLALIGKGDNVHMRRRGYTMLADIFVDKFMYDYCRGV